MNTRISTSNPELEQDMRNVVNEVEDLLTTVGKEGGARAREVQDRVIAALDAAKQRLNTIDSQVRASARQAAEVTDDYVHERPWQAVAAGAIAGLLIGLLIARR
jgi:ElaB/YqjD/DUF883 family membrane-anchored ribosome-binding protein